MVWFKVDDDLTFHPRVTRAGNAAMGLWLRAGTYCSEHLTDGWLSHAEARTIGSAAEIKKLVTVGLWYEQEHQGEKGYQFHRWAEDHKGQKRQPTRAEVEEQRRRDRERKVAAGKKGNQTRWGSGRIPPGFQTESDGNPDGVRVDSDRLPVAPDPTQDPTRPKTENPPGSLSPAEPSKRKRPIPKDFTPTDDHRQYAHQHHLDLGAELQAFRDHAQMTGRQGIDWNAGFRNWLKKGAEIQAARPVQRVDRERPMGEEFV